VNDRTNERPVSISRSKPGPGRPAWGWGFSVGSFFWFPVVGVRRTTATVSAPARVAAGDPLFGGFFFGVQPSGFGPLGRMVEGSPGGSPFATPDLPETLPGNEGEAAVNVRLYRRFLDLRKCSFSEARFCAGESISENRSGGEAEE